MALSTDVVSAKRELSRRLLKVGLQGKVLARPHAQTVAAAVEAARHNVHGVGAGAKTVGGLAIARQCVRIYVTQKLAPSLLATDTILPTEVDGIPTDVIEAPPAFIQQAPECSVHRRSRQRPVVGGISTAHHTVTAGTIACFCRSTRDGDDPDAVYALSNNHVFADVNHASRGDDLYQPGPADGGTHADHFAEYTRAVDIQLGGVTPNTVDAAIGRLLASTRYDAAVCTIGSITNHEPPEEDMIVRKHGRTTGYTQGRITDESYDALIGMDHNDPSLVALFENQIRIERIDPYRAFGLGGDSGSLVVHRDRSHAVGLYFAGPDSGIYGVANPMAAVLGELEIVII